MPQVANRCTTFLANETMFLIPATLGAFSRQPSWNSMTARTGRSPYKGLAIRAAKRATGKRNHLLFRVCRGIAPGTVQTPGDTILPNVSLMWSPYYLTEIYIGLREEPSTPDERSWFNLVRACGTASEYRGAPLRPASLTPKQYRDQTKGWVRTSALNLPNAVLHNFNSIVVTEIQYDEAKYQLISETGGPELRTIRYTTGGTNDAVTGSSRM